MADEPLALVPIPALIVLLLNLERQKGGPLTEQEVIDARDKAVCMAVPASMVAKLEQERGYPDINPENVWPEWQAARKELREQRQ